MTRSTVALRTKFGISAGALILLAAIACMLRIAYVYTRYPGLIDPTEQPVAYWPELDVFIGSVIAGILAIIGIPVFWLSAWSYCKQRSNGP